MMKEGLTQEEAINRIFLFDSHGLVTKDREGLTPLKQKFAHELEPQSTFLDAIGEVKPTAIVGCAAQAGSFNAYVLSAMARINERPIIFALSNPTSRSECTAREAYTYTEGKCLFASGSPFPQVEVNGKTFIPRQSNNSYVFPRNRSRISCLIAPDCSTKRFFRVLQKRSLRLSRKTTWRTAACSRRSQRFAKSLSPSRLRLPSNVSQRALPACRNPMIYPKRFRRRCTSLSTIGSDR